MGWGRLICVAVMGGLAAGAAMADTFTVKAGEIADQKAVFATVESAHVATARSQLGGTIESYLVQPGDTVTQGETIATIVDPTLAAQLAALDAEITGLRAQLAEAQTNYAHDQTLIQNGAIASLQLDDAQTAWHVAASSLASRIAARASLSQQIQDGAVLAPVTGRVLDTPVTQGMVVLPGDSIAHIAEQNYVLRLDLPERHIGFIKPGDPVVLADDGGSPPVFGRITLIYPQIENGEVQADATAPDLGGYFVGQRVEVWVAAGVRPGIIIPARFIETMFGLDYVQLRDGQDGITAVPVQSGAPQPSPAFPDGVEILSGLHPGDVLVAP